MSDDEQCFQQQVNSQASKTTTNTMNRRWVKISRNIIVILRVTQVFLLGFMIPEAQKDSTAIKEGIVTSLEVFYVCQIIYSLVTTCVFWKGDNLFNNRPENFACKDCGFLIFLWAGGIIGEFIFGVYLGAVLTKPLMDPSPIGNEPFLEWSAYAHLTFFSLLFWIIDIVIGLPLIFFVCCCTYDGIPRRSQRRSSRSLAPQPSTIILTLQPVNSSEMRQTETTTVKEETVIEGNSRTCVICSTKPSNVIFQPCNHLCVCEEDARKIMISTRQQCPRCRERIIFTIRLYPA